MISSFVSKPFCFCRVPNSRLRRTGRVGHVRKYIKCQAEVEFYRGLKQFSHWSEEEAKIQAEYAQQTKINSKFRSAETASDWLASLKEEGDSINEVNVSVAAHTLGKIVYQFKKLDENGFVFEISEQQKSEFIECYSGLIEKIEQFISKLQPRTIANCSRCLNYGNKILKIEKILVNYRPVLQKLLERSIEIQDEFFLDELMKILYVTSYDYNLHKKEFDILFKKAKEFDLKKFTKFNATDMSLILVNSKCSDINYINAYIDMMVQKFFNDLNKTFIGNLAQTQRKLRVKNQKTIENIKIFLNKKKKLNGRTLAEFCELIATFLSDSDEKNSMIDGIFKLIEKYGALYWTEDFVKILYCLAAMKAPVEKINQINNVLIQKLENKFYSLSSEQLRNLRWVQIFCESQNQQVDFPEELVYLCKNEQKQFIQNQIEQIKNDQFVNEVYEKVKGSYPEAECGVEISDGDLFISILLENAEKKFAIEPLSDDQFVLSENQSENQLLGIQQSELDVISSKGFSVLPVSELQWVDNVVYQDEIINSLQ